MNALRHCVGDAVAFCDQDDVWDPLKLERCISAMSTDPTATLVLHDCEEVTSDLSPLGIILRAKSSPASDPAGGRCRVIRHPALGCCMLLHRRVVDAVLRYWPESHLRYTTRSRSRGALGHDTVAVHLAAVLGRVVYLSDSLVHHRRHSQNTWSPDLTSVLSSTPPKFEARIAMLRENARTAAVAAAMFEEMSERAEAAGDANAARYLERLADRDLESSRFFAGRAELYGTRSRLARLARFSSMFRAGAYASLGGPLTSGRCGFKDLAFACLGPAAPMLLEKMRSQLRLDFHPQELIR